MEKMIMAIDPGKSGGIATLYNGEVNAYKMPQTDQDMLDLFANIMSECNNQITCMTEVVHAFPGQGVTSMFSFGEHYGALKMALLAMNIPFIAVLPVKWMRGLALGTKKDNANWKNHLKSKAQQLYPNIKITLNTADALLILEYARTYFNTAKSQNGEHQGFL